MRIKLFLVTLASTALIFWGLGTVTPTWAASMYAKQKDVKVTSEKSPKSAVITNLKLGEEVTVLEKSGRLLKIQTADGKTGWVFKFRLSDKEPSSGGSLLSGLRGRRKLAARESRTGGSIRGLKESTEHYAATKHIKQEHRDAVDRMELFTIPQEELTRFKQEGRLGEYSGGVQ